MQVKGSPNLGARVKNTIDKGTEGTFKKSTQGFEFKEFTASDKAFVRAESDGEGRWNDRSGIVHGR